MIPLHVAKGVKVYSLEKFADPNEKI